MPKILHIESSPRGDRSASITVAKAFIEAYKTSHHDDQVETLDLWHTSIPEFDGCRPWWAMVRAPASWA